MTDHLLWTHGEKFMVAESYKGQQYQKVAKADALGMVPTGGKYPGRNLFAQQTG